VSTGPGATALTRDAVRRQSGHERVSDSPPLWSRRSARRPGTGLCPAALLSSRWSRARAQRRHAACATMSVPYRWPSELTTDRALRSTGRVAQSERRRRVDDHVKPAASAHALVTAPLTSFELGSRRGANECRCRHALSRRLLPPRYPEDGRTASGDATAIASPIPSCNGAVTRTTLPSNAFAMLPLFRGSLDSRGVNMRRRADAVAARRRRYALNYDRVVEEDCPGR